MTPTGSLGLALTIIALAVYLILCARQFKQAGEAKRSALYSVVASVGMATAVALLVLKV